jgi:hypothetical protein
MEMKRNDETKSFWTTDYFSPWKGLKRRWRSFFFMAKQLFKWYVLLDFQVYSKFYMPLNKRRELLRRWIYWKELECLREVRAIDAESRAVDAEYQKVLKENENKRGISSSTTV